MTFLRTFFPLLLIVSPWAIAAAEEPPWRDLFDGRSLDGWEVVTKWDFARHGRCVVEDGCLVLGEGDPFTGLRYQGKFPTCNYEVEFKARRVEGRDFFLGVVFPVGERPLSFVLGGWGGEVVGLTNIDGEPAVENQTCQYIEFENGRWYVIRLRVTDKRIQLSIDDRQVIDHEIGYGRLTIRMEQEPLLPFGISTWKTTGACKMIRLRRITEP